MATKRKPYRPKASNAHIELFAHQNFKGGMKIPLYNIINNVDVSADNLMVVPYGDWKQFAGQILGLPRHYEFDLVISFFNAEPDITNYQIKPEQIKFEEKTMATTYIAISDIITQMVEEFFNDDFKGSDDDINWEQSFVDLKLLKR